MSRTRLLSVAVCIGLIASLYPGVPVIAGQSTVDMEQFEQRIEEARKQLDDAAHQIKELYLQKYASGSSSKKAMLGILLDQDQSTDGVEIIGVTPGGGAAAAGLQAGDLIVEIAGAKLATAGKPMDALGKELSALMPGEDVAVVFERDDQRHSVQVTTTQRAAHILKVLDDDIDFDFDFDVKGDMRSASGITQTIEQEWELAAGSKQLMHVKGNLAGYFDVKEGVLLLSAPEDSALKAGDILLGIGDAAVENVAGAASALSALADATDVRVKRKGRERTITVQAGEFDSMATTGTRVIHIKRPGASRKQKIIVEIEED